MRRFPGAAAGGRFRTYTGAGMGEDPNQHFDERAAGLAMLGTILFCAAVGGGVGIFFEQPVIGAIGGALIGILLGFWLVPRLMRDWD